MNMGGWFVMEKFLNPSLFQLANDSRVICEWTYCQYLKNDTTKMDALRNHWNNWVTEEDMLRLNQLGITHLRIPIGYWSMMTQEELEAKEEPYLTGQWPVLVRALQWAKKYNLKAIIDLHAAPGSQNGWDNSGRQGMVNWGTGDTVNRTLELLERLAMGILQLEMDNTTSGVVIGLEVMNEAFPYKMHGGIDTVVDHYIRSYPIVRRHLPASKYWFVIEGAFSEPHWVNFMASPEYEKVYLDIHVYHCFDDGLRRAPYATHLDITCNQDSLKVPSQTLPTFVGEWSVAWKVESNFAAGEPFPTEDQQQFMREFCLSQMKVYGSFFWWNFKTEHAPMWDYFLGVDNGWIPLHLPSPDVGNACPHQNSTL